MKRCKWAENTFDAYTKYHDEEWGVPVHDDRVHFEFLTLESAQSGLSWATILKKRAGYRKAFADFDFEKVASFDESQYQLLLQNPEIIRNKLKIGATINNAARFIAVIEEFGSFDEYIWRFVDGKPIVNYWKATDADPSKTALSDIISKDLKKRGFKFVGSTTVYSQLEATGLLNNHLVSCFRHAEVQQLY
ncbi:MAG: DNA-3-methyladenine glycosylase I [Bacteroidota bacterium]